MKFNKTIGMVTIGQSPRDDLHEEICNELDEKFQIVQAGALDGLQREEIE